MKKFKIKKFAYFIISSLLFVAAFNEPIEKIVVDITKKSFTELNSKEGIVDIQLFKNYPFSLTKRNQILTLYKGENSPLVEIKKKNSSEEIWFSNKSDMKVFLDKKGDSLNAIGDLSDDKLLGILSNPSSLVTIKNINRQMVKPLVIMTAHEYYLENIKNILGVSFSVGLLIFILITSYYKNKIIQSSDDKNRKSIILLP